MLLVDLDPQACLTFSLGIDPEDVELSIHHVLTKGTHASEVVIETDDGVDLLPATIELARAEADLLTRTGREQVLKAALADLADEAHYDWVLLDCPPSLGVLTVAALTAADGVLIPLQCETLSHRGVGQLLDTVHDVRRFTNRDLEVWGVLPTLYDGRTNHARTVLETISETYDLEVIEPPIPKTIKFAEAPAAGRSILATSRSSKGAKAYREAATHLVERSAQARHACEAQGPRAGVSRHRGDPAAPALRADGRGRSRRSCVTLVAVLGGFGVLPVSLDPRQRLRRPVRRASGPTTRRPRPTRVRRRPTPARRRHPGQAEEVEGQRHVGRLHREPGRPPARRRRCPRAPAPASAWCSARAASGSGWSTRTRRWSAPTSSRAASTTTSSPGAFNVYSRSEDAWGVDDSGSMKYFVRFTQGDTGAAIGFHDIPVKDGELAQTEAQLGTPTEPRLHPAAALRRDRAVGVRPARYVGDRHRLSPLERSAVRLVSVPTRSAVRRH